MKTTKFLLCMILCLSLLLGGCVFLTSCKPEEQTFNTGSREENMKLEKDKPLQVINSGLDRNDKTHPVNIGLDRFEATYNRKVDFITCGFAEWNQKVMASIASGTPIDVVNAGNYEFPLFAMKKYAQPIDELVNLNAPYVDKPVVDVFLYQGKHYVAASTGSSIPLVIYYNKNMFENEGVEDPMELYKADKWTTDKLKEIAMKFTRDTNGDGAYDQWGMSAWYQCVFFGSSATSVCKINDKGLFELQLQNNPNLVEALELIRSAWFEDKWIGLEGGDIFDSFYLQNNAMVNEFAWAGKTILKAKERGEFAFDVGAAPFPYGKTNTDKVNFCFLNGFAILNGCACPYSAGALIEMMMEEYAKDYEKSKEYVPKEWQDLYDDMIQRPFNSFMMDNAVDSGKALCTKVAGGMDIQQALEMYQPVYQALIDEANKIPEDKVEHDFTPIHLDFTKGGTDGVLQASDTKSLKVSNPGDHLHIAMNTAEYGDACPALKTDADKYPIWGYKSYKVSFDYRVESIPGEISVYMFELKREGLPMGSMNTFVPEQGAIGNWTHGEVVLSGVNDNHPLSLYLSGQYANTIDLKNLHIEEVDA